VRRDVRVKYEARVEEERREGKNEERGKER
jgi:hypothetical protein